MIEIVIHLGSFAVGFFVGYLVLATVWIGETFTKRWDDGFNVGWKAGKDYGMKAKQEEKSDD